MQKPKLRTVEEVLAELFVRELREGDRVRIIKKDHMYPTYFDWIRINKLQKYYWKSYCNQNHPVKNGDVGTIKFIAGFTESDFRTLLALVEVDGYNGEHFIYLLKGLKLIESGDSDGKA